MLGRKTLLLVAAAGLIAGCGHEAEDSGKVRGEIDARNKEIGAALAKGDYNTVAGMYSSSAQMFPPNHATVSGHDAIVAEWKGFVDAGFKGLELASNEVEAVGDHADEEGSYRRTGPDGQTTIDTGKYIVIWKKENGKWVLHRDIWNSNNPVKAMAAATPAAADQPAGAGAAAAGSGAPGAAPQAPGTATPPPTTTPDQTAPPPAKPQ